jgi:drug/metabolite transporter (DMT)-like permease
LPSGFVADKNHVSDVRFQYGTSLTEPHLQGAPPVVPEPSSILVWSTLLAYIAFREFPDSVSLLGMLIIVFAGLLAVNWKQMRRRADATEKIPVH